MTYLLHSGLKTEEIAKHHGSHFEMLQMKIQHSQHEIKYALHVAPSGFTLSGMQSTDILALLGFNRGRCSFFPSGECFVKEVAISFDLEKFDKAFTAAYRDVKDGAGHLEKCGIHLEQKDGWSYFTGRKRTRIPLGYKPQGDGHTAPKHERMKESEDDNFYYVFTWISGGAEKGWTTHYRAKHQPLSREVESVFNYLSLEAFSNCPEFDFQPCHWKFTQFKDREDRSFFNAEYAHAFFDAHAEHFSLGVEKLLDAQSAFQPFGMNLLPGVVVNVPADNIQPPRPQDSQTKARKRASDSEYKYDVAFSFAGTERELTEQIATKVHEAGFEVFYDGFYKAQLWGKDLAVFFDEVYRKESRYCLILVSNEYTSRMWTNHERRSAVARLIKEKGREYILPVKIDSTDLDGVPPTLGYISIEEHSADEIADLLISKLKG